MPDMPRALVFLSLLIFAQCIPEGASKKPPKARLLCEAYTDEASGTPLNEVYLLSGEQKVKIAEIGACDTLPPASYPEYGIPANALSACGGGDGESGDYLYLLREGKNLLVFHKRLQDAEAYYEEIFRTTLK
jgi:hypothetical protein